MAATIRLPLRNPAHITDLLRLGLLRPGLHLAIMGLPRDLMAPHLAVLLLMGLLLARLPDLLRAIPMDLRVLLPPAD